MRFSVDDGKYICVATNLPEDEFPLEEIKKLYKRRWSEETSFRELKYTIGLINWHSHKPSGIIQGMYAKLILYNYCAAAVAHAVIRTGNILLNNAQSVTVTLYTEQHKACFQNSLF